MCKLDHDSVFARVLLLVPLVLIGTARPGSGQCWTETGKLLLPQPQNAVHFGEAVAIWGGTVVVGASREYITNPGNGAVGVYYRNQGGPNAWGNVAMTIGTFSGQGAVMGTSVALHEDTLVAGAPRELVPGPTRPGAVHVFERHHGAPDAWGEVAVLFASDAESGDWFGESVAVFDDTILVGSPFDGDLGPFSGGAYVFERNQGGPNAWGEVQKLLPSDGVVGHYFGGCVGLWEDTAVASAPGDSQTKGAIYVFERGPGGVWTEQAKVVAPNGWYGDNLGTSLCLREDTLVAGAPYDLDLGLGTGSASIFGRDIGGLGAWGEIAELHASDAQLGDHFGWSVSVFEGVVAVGSKRSTVFVFEQGLSGANGWGELDRLQSPGQSAYTFGTSVALQAGTMVVGDTGDGAAYVFEDTSSAQRYCTAGTSGSGCRGFLMACGTPSASAASGFVVSAASVEGQEEGIFYYAASGRQADPWGNGTSFQCVVPPVRRGGVLTSGGTAGACDGSFAQDLNARWCSTCPRPNHNPGAGAIVRAQLWYHDPQNTGNQTTSLSDALEFVLAP